MRWLRWWWVRRSEFAVKRAAPPARGVGGHAAGTRAPAPRAAGEGKGAGSNKVRIIAGAWRSRVITFPDVPGLRPTADRVRGTLFNWLGQDLTGLRCLDLFAGSGALGFEALSRNARHVTMIERDARARAALSQTANTLGAGGGLDSRLDTRLDIIGADALQFLLQCNGRHKTENQRPELFDVVFCDPPFQQEWFSELWAPLAGVLAEGGVVYAESAAALAPPAPWQVHKSGRAGAVHYHLINIAAPETE
jgi:16S rRNA (guanine(966)-N(2))-methyltransferase RsmD